MPEEFHELDDLTSEEVAIFKEEARLEEQVSDLALTEAAVGVSERLVAEGDSWFDYLPGTDIIDCLRRHHGYRIFNYAKAGDTLENMIYGTDINNQFERVNPTIENVLRRIGQLKPKVFLFSGGGNDVAGEEFETYLNHNDSGLPPVRSEFVDTMVNVVFREYFEDLIRKVVEVSPETHIIVHGYGHTHPTGKGVNLFIFTFAGPWLRPALAKKGIFDPTKQRQAVRVLIDTFNELLKDLAQNHTNFHYVDLRDLIDPENDWVNELHLRNSAFARVAQQIHQTILALP